MDATAHFYEQFVDEVIVEGSPGSGKTTALRKTIPDLVESLADTHTVFLNNRPWYRYVDEMAMHVPAGRNKPDSFMFKRYDKAARAQHLMETATVGWTMAQDRVLAYQRFAAEYERHNGAKRILNVLERDARTAFNLFSPANYYHVIESPASIAAQREAREQSVFRTYATERDTRLTWIEFSSVVASCAGMVKLLYDVYRPKRTVMIWLDVDPDLCYKRMMARGHPVETAGLDRDYMYYLHKAHKVYCGNDRVVYDELNGRVSLFENVFNAGHDLCLRVHGDRFDGDMVGCSMAIRDRILAAIDLEE